MEADIQAVLDGSLDEFRGLYQLYETDVNEEQWEDNEDD